MVVPLKQLQQFRAVKTGFERRILMRILAAVSVMLAAAFAAGCHGPYAGKTYGPGTTTIEKTNRIVFTSARLASTIRVVDVNAAFVEGERLRVVAELENMTGSTKVVQVQTQFRDASGDLSPDMTNWKNVILAPHSSTSYEAISMNDKARDYVIRVKPEKT